MSSTANLSLKLSHCFLEKLKACGGRLDEAGEKGNLEFRQKNEGVNSRK